MARLHGELFGVPLVNPSYAVTGLTSNKNASSPLPFGRNPIKLVLDVFWKNPVSAAEPFARVGKLFRRQSFFSVGFQAVLLDARTAAVESDGLDVLENIMLVCGDHLSAEKELKDKEMKRRERIGLANKGKVPWNKGKNHSPETIARISQSTREMMKDPKIREKLRLGWHPHTEETKEKLRKLMKERRQAQRRQLRCVIEWMECIAETARAGDFGEEEMQWDSFTKLKNALKDQYIATLKEQRRRQRTIRKVWTLEQRTKLSQSIKTKWDDPSYRQNVCAGISEARKHKTAHVRKNVVICSANNQAELHYTGKLGFDKNGVPALTSVQSSTSTKRCSNDKILYGPNASTETSEFKKHNITQIRNEVATCSANKAEAHENTVLFDCASERAHLSINSFTESTDEKVSTWTSGSSNNELSTSKVVSYVDPLAEEKLDRIRLLRALKLKEKHKSPERSTKSAQTGIEVVELADFNTEGSIKTGSTNCSDYNPKRQDCEKQLGSQAVKPAEQEGDEQVRYEVTEAVWHEAAERAQHEATERARMLMAEAERATIVAAKALEAAGTRDVGVKYSLAEARNLLNEARHSIKIVELGRCTEN